MSEVKNQQFLLGLLGGIAAVSIVGLIILGIAFINVSGDNEGAVAGEKDQEQNQNPNQNTPTAGNKAPALTPSSVEGVTTFSEKKGAEICTEDGKPVVYLFSTTWCPHCVWVNDTFNSVAKEYVDAGKIKAYHWEIDTNDDVLTSEKETVVPAEHLAIYREFNPNGSIPTFVFGCKYSRIGNGHERQNDLDAEAAEFRALIDSMIK